MKQSEYYDKAKEVLGITSDYAFSLEIGIDRGTMKKCRDEKLKFDQYTIFKLSEILGIEEKKITSDIYSQSEKNEDKKEYWIEQRKKYQQGCVENWRIWLGILGVITIPTSAFLIYSKAWTNTKLVAIFEGIGSFWQTGKTAHNTYYVK